MWIAIGVLGALVILILVVLFLMNKNFEYLEQEISSTHYKALQLEEQITNNKKMFKDFIDYLGYKMTTNTLTYFFEKVKIDREYWREDQKQRIEDMILRRRISRLEEELKNLTTKTVPSKDAVEQVEQIIKIEVDGYKRQAMRTMEDVGDITNVIGMILDYLKVDVVRTPEKTELKKVTKKKGTCCGR